MTDNVFRSFLERQAEEGRALAAKSDILRLLPELGTSPHRYIAEFRCKGVIQHPEGRIGECGLFIVGINFPHDYLRRASTPEVLTWLGPATVFHPNIRGSGPTSFHGGAICIGRLQPGTGLVDILYQVFELIVYLRFNSREWDCLNPAACAWARANVSRFPTDPRPLKRPEHLAEIAAGEQGGAP